MTKYFVHPGAQIFQFNGKMTLQLGTLKYDMTIPETLDAQKFIQFCLFLPRAESEIVNEISTMIMDSGVSQALFTSLVGIHFFVKHEKYSHLLKFHHSTNWGSFTHPSLEGSTTKGTPKEYSVPKKNTGFYDVLDARRSERAFSHQPLRLKMCAEICMASYSKIPGNCVTPSAGATYPIIIYMYANQVEGEPSGWFEFKGQSMERLDAPLLSLKNTFYTQGIDLASCSAAFVFVLDLDLICSRYGERGYRYGMIECGHLCQNMLLISTERNLASIPVGGIKDESISQLLNLPSNRLPMYSLIMGGASY